MVSGTHGFAEKNKAEILFTSVERGNQVEIKSFLSNASDFYAVIRSNTYALQDYSYRLLVSVPEKKLIKLDGIGADQQFLKVGRMETTKDGSVIIPLANKSMAYFYRYDPTTRSLTLHASVDVGVNINSIFFSGGKYFVAGTRSGRPLLYELVSSNKNSYSLRNIDLNGYDISIFHDIYMDEAMYLVAEFAHQSSKKEYGVLKLPVAGQAKYVAMPRIGPTAEIKIIGFKNGVIAVSIADFAAASYKKDSSIFFTDFNSINKYKTFSGDKFQSAILSGCLPFDGVSVNVLDDKDNDKLSYQNLISGKNFTIDFSGEFAKLYGQVVATRSGGNIYAGLVYNEIRNYKSFQIFSVVRFSLADSFSCEKYGPST